MAYKTMLRQLISKWGIMSIDMQEVMEKDMAVLKQDGTYEYVDNMPEFETPIIQQEEAATIEQNEQVNLNEVNINDL